MSVKMMAAIFESRSLGPTKRLVMLALADHADDTGRCYPSIVRLQDRTGLSERAVRDNIRALEAEGYLNVTLSAGPGGKNLYTVNPEGGQQMPPAVNAPGSKCPPGGHLVPVRGAPDAPEPSGTINKPPEDRSAREIAAVLEAWAPPKAVASFMAYRKKTKAKALTMTGAERLAKGLAEIFAAGFDPGDALGLAEERGWVTVKPDWYFRERGGENGAHNSPQRPNGPGPRGAAGIVAGFAAAARQGLGRAQPDSGGISGG